jgi:hypothetical protein
VMARTTMMQLSCLTLVKDLQNELEDCGLRPSFLQLPLRSFNDLDLCLGARVAQVRLDHTALDRTSSHRPSMNPTHLKGRPHGRGRRPGLPQHAHVHR